MSDMELTKKEYSIAYLFRRVPAVFAWDQSLDPLFLIGFGMFMISEVLRETAWYWMNAGTFEPILKAVHLLSVLLLLIVFFLRDKYTPKAILFAVFSLILLAVNFLFTRNATLLYFLIILIAAYHVDLEKVVRLSAVIHAAILAGVIIASGLGLAMNAIFDSAGRIRYALGFSYVNKAPTFFFFLVLEILYLKRFSVKWYVLLLMALFSGYLFMETDSRMPFLLTLVILVFTFIRGIFRRKNKPFRKHLALKMLVPVLFCLLTILLYVAFSNQGFLAQINSWMSGRLALGSRAMQNYGVTLFGQQVQWVGFSIVQGDTYNYVDCAYIQTLISNGAFVLAWMIVLYQMINYAAVLRRDHTLSMITFFILLFCVMEPRLVSLTYNVFPLFAIVVLQQKKRKQKPQALGN